MEPRNENCNCTAFSDSKIIATGAVIKVAQRVKKYLEKNRNASVLIFDDITSNQIEIDFRGSCEAVVGRLNKSLAENESMGKSLGPGRPKLGVISREVGLLPRHWDWLALQPSGASATLRKLVEEAKKKNQAQDKVRQAQDATYKFMQSMTGDLPHYEEALRAFYAKNKSLFETIIASWPKDIKAHINKLVETLWG